MFRTILIFMICFLVAAQIMAQGISRSSGIGLRGGYWKAKDRRTLVRVSDNPANATVDVSGASGSLYFFSRLIDNYFFETSIGGMSSVHVESDGFNSDDVNVSSIVPFLFGVRYDILSARYASSFQPYVASGIGPYWFVDTQVRGNTDYGTDNEVTIGSDLKVGGYLGGGMNIALASWFALNFDLRYHFIDFKTEDENSGPEFSLGFCFMWGKKREIFRVRNIKMVIKNLYPAYYQFYNTYPLAFVTIENTGGFPIEVNVKSYIRGFSERRAESGFIALKRGETKDIPVHAFFGSKLFQTSQRRPAIIDLEIEAKAGAIQTKSLTAEIIVHSRNAWNGDMDKLKFFLTPDNAEILNIGREIRKDIEGKEDVLQNFYLAEHIFNWLKEQNIDYHPDPNIPFYQDDRVQFASETLEIGSGDCDDLVVLYASLLEGVGIKTAFVEVRDPQKEMAHLYLMFDTGLDPSRGNVITNNEKRYIVRENTVGQKKIWIPIETTMIQQGFERAWNTAAMAYLQEGVLRNGLGEGWVKVID